MHTDAIWKEGRHSDPVGALRNIFQVQMVCLDYLSVHRFQVAGDLDPNFFAHCMKQLDVLFPVTGRNLRGIETV